MNVERPASNVIACIKRRMWRESHLVLVLTIIGVVCSGSGCAKRSLTVDDTTYYLRGDESPSRWRVVSLVESQMVFPAAGTRTTALVKEQQLTASERKLMEVVKNTPRRQRLDPVGGDLFSAVSSLTSDVSTDRIKWIVSVDPLIVAVGREDASAKRLFDGAYINAQSLVEIGFNIRLPSAAEFHEPVRDVYRIESWPPDLEPFSPPPVGRQRLQSGEPEVLEQVLLKTDAEVEASESR